MEDSITLVSLTEEAKMEGFATAEQVTYILTSALHVTCTQLKDFVAPLLRAANKYLPDRSAVDLQSWFRLTNTSEFLSKVSVVVYKQMIEGRGPTSNIRLFRTSLYLYIKECIT